MAELIITTKEELQFIVKESMKDLLDKNNPKPQPVKKPYTKIEVKNLLGVAMPTIDRWSKKGILKRIEIGSRVYFSVESVEALIK